MNYYIRTIETTQPPQWQLWKIEGDIAVRVGIFRPEGVAGCYFKANAGETIWQTIRRLTPWFEPNGENPFHEISLEPGQYYPRMARPSDQHPKESPGHYPGVLNDLNAAAIAYGQLDALISQLQKICQTVQPIQKNFGTFGHDIRNLLILACTEVESHWRGILSANGIIKDKYNTVDYVKLSTSSRAGGI